MQKVGLIFGGMGNEHEVSISSAQNIIKHIDTTKYHLILLYQAQNGSFYTLDNISELSSLGEEKRILFEEIKHWIDIALPMTHGKYGEDGVLQGLLERQHIPYCGCRTLGSSICMDKGMFKELMELHHIQQTKFQCLDFTLLSEEEVEKLLLNIQQDFVLPLYIKPANSGSSI